MIGLGYRLAQQKRRKPLKQCERCGLSYQKDAEQCPYCTGMDDEGLRRLRRRLRTRDKKMTRLGLRLLYLAFGLMAAVLLFAGLG